MHLMQCSTLLANKSKTLSNFNFFFSLFSIFIAIWVVRDRVIIGVHQCRLYQVWLRTQVLVVRALQRSRIRYHRHHRRRPTMRIRWTPPIAHIWAPIKSRCSNWRRPNRTYQEICHQIPASIQRPSNRAEAKQRNPRSSERRWAAADRRNSIDISSKWPLTKKWSIVSAQRWSSTVAHTTFIYSFPLQIFRVHSSVKFCCKAIYT